MKEMFNELIQYRHLLYMLVWRDVKIRYKQTAMGFLWAIFMPMMVVCAGLLIKKGMSIFSGKPMLMSELLSVTVKALPYSFFVGSIRFATGSLVGNRNLVTKIYFPREVFPIAAVMANVFDFTIASTIFIFIMAIAGFGVSIHALWLPWLLLMLVLLAIGFGMLLSCANLFYRDVKYIVEAVLTFAIFFTPVFYEASLFGKWSTLLLLNPLGAILENINNVVVLHRPPDMVWLAYATIWSVGGFMIGWRVFHKLEYVFAENI